MYCKVCQNEKITVQSEMWGCADKNNTKQGKVNSFIELKSKVVKNGQLYPGLQRVVFFLIILLHFLLYFFYLALLDCSRKRWAVYIVKFRGSVKAAQDWGTSGMIIPLKHIFTEGTQTTSKCCIVGSQTCFSTSLHVLRDEANIKQKV